MKIKMEDMGKEPNGSSRYEKHSPSIPTSLDRINIRLDTTEEKTREPEDIATETVQSAAQREIMAKKQRIEPQ